MIFIVCSKLFKEKAFIGVGTIKYGWMLQLSFSELDSWFHTDSDDTVPTQRKYVTLFVRYKRSQMFANMFKAYCRIYFFANNILFLFLAVHFKAACPGRDVNVKKRKYM